MLHGNSGSCSDAGCVAIQWNLSNREGILLDLFKAKGGDRHGCDLSSATDAGVQWGRLMMRVVDDVAFLVRADSVHVKDEASVTMQVWDEEAQGPVVVPVSLHCIRPLLKGIGYYEAAGFYPIPRGQFYFEPRHSANGGALADDASMQTVHTTRHAAATRLSAFNALRTAPFEGGGLCRALEAIDHDEGVVRGMRPAPPDVRSTLIHRFALAVGAAHGAPPPERPAAFHAAVSRQDGGEPLPHRFNVHARCMIPYVEDLTLFAQRHSNAIDAKLLSEQDLGGMARCLHERNLRGGPAGWRAGALLMALTHDFLAAWSPRREQPLLRKDYDHSRDECTSVELATSGASVSLARREPIIRDVYVLDA